MACEGGEGLPATPESGHPKDPFVGNVSRCIPLPPDHPTDGGVKRGKLQFDACFEGGEGDICVAVRVLSPYMSVWMLLIHTHCHSSSHAGNLGRVDYISDFEYDLFIRPDTCNPRYANSLCSSAVASHSSYTLGIVSGSTLLCRMSAQTR